jgi:hypothetical protein
MDMKRNKYSPGLTCLLLLAGIFPAGLTNNVRAEAREYTGTAGEAAGGMSLTRKEYSGEKSEFERKAKKTLGEFDRKIKELEMKAKEADSKANVEVREGLTEVREKRDALKRELNKLHNTGNKKLERAKKRAEAAEKELEAAYDRVKSFFSPE